MLVSEFTFNLPKELIANSPAVPRDSSRLLDLSSAEISDKFMYDFPDLLKEGDLLVFNNTEVIPARLFGNRNGAKAEVTLHKQLSTNSWKAFAKPARKLKIGDKFTINEDFYATVKNKNEGEVELEFNVDGAVLYEMLERYGKMPLPPYIERKEGSLTSDNKNYQTIFASKKGAVAAPTAGLHFTENLLERIAEKGVKICFVTLHVGAGTFLPVKVEDTKDHVMHSEYGVLSCETTDLINQTKRDGGRVIAVGTTSLRLLESAAGDDGVMHPFTGDTDIFITPGYRFKITDALLTNFHLPESTLFMLVCAFAGTDKMKSAYQYAITNKYRFYSYGDACFLNRLYSISSFCDTSLF